MSGVFSKKTINYKIQFRIGVHENYSLNDLSSVGQNHSI